MSQFVVEERAVNSFFGGPIASKKSSKKKATVENLSQIQAKLFNAGISKSTIIKAPAVTLSDGVKISYTGNFDNDVSRNCNWCKCQIVTEKLGVPLWMENKKYYSEGCFCSFNCCLAFIQSQKSIRYKDSLGFFYIICSKIGLEMDSIIPSEHWTRQQNFNGDLSTNDYKKNFVYLSTDKVTEYNNLVKIVTKIVFAN